MRSCEQTCTPPAPRLSEFLIYFMIGRHMVKHSQGIQMCRYNNPFLCLRALISMYSTNTWRVWGRKTERSSRFDKVCIVLFICWGRCGRIGKFVTFRGSSSFTPPSLQPVSCRPRSAAGFPRDNPSSPAFAAGCSAGAPPPCRGWWCWCSPPPGCCCRGWAGSKRLSRPGRRTRSGSPCVSSAATASGHVWKIGWCWR